MMRAMLPTVVAGVILTVGAYGQTPQTSKVTHESVEGISNFARLDTTIACGGATKPEAVAELKRMGFASIINVREASEQGADVEKEAAAAKAAASISSTCRSTFSRRRPISSPVSWPP